jgi:hypothetical protein
VCAGKFSIDGCRIDLLPTVAMERLGLHNELCSLKWADPDKWMREGFRVSQRFDSMKRHYESVHAQDPSEDHLAHLIWGFMALTHVIAVFPHLNDLHDFEADRRANIARATAASGSGDNSDGSSVRTVGGDSGDSDLRHKRHTGGGFLIRDPPKSPPRA